MSSQPHVRASRNGRPYRRARELMFSMYGRNCWICGHPGANDAGHVKSLAQEVERTGGKVAPDPRAMRPMHGSTSPCPQCGGRRCNQEQGTAHLASMFQPKLVL